MEPVIDCIRQLSDLKGRAYYTSQQIAQQNAGRWERYRDVTDLVAHTDLGTGMYGEVYVEGGASESSFGRIENRIGPDPFLFAKRRQEYVQVQSLLKRLPERERFILQQYYILGKSMSEIARENGSMSKSWVSRLHG